MSKPSPDATSSRTAESVIPDCCNMGVIFRTLIAVNVAVLAANMLGTNAFGAGLQEYVESSILVELACLSSLVLLCGFRMVAGAIPAWGQRLACAAIPAAVVTLLIQFFSPFGWFQDSFIHLTVWKGMLTAALFGIVLQHYFELRTRAFSPALAEARLQALQARIRPHFLFNSLNAVLSLIRTEPRRAETTLEDLADLFRVLVRDARDMTTLDEEIRLCKQYLSIEQVRLGDRLQVAWEVRGISEEVQRKARVPALLLQPLLENAVHYGVEPARDPVLIRINVSRGIDRIEIVVVNPYHGDATTASQGNHMALDNIRERLALLYDVEAQLTTTIARGFFEVRLRFPYERQMR